MAKELYDVLDRIKLLDVKLVILEVILKIINKIQSKVEVFTQLLPNIFVVLKDGFLYITNFYLD